MSLSSHGRSVFFQSRAPGESWGSALGVLSEFSVSWDSMSCRGELVECAVCVYVGVCACLNYMYV